MCLHIDTCDQTAIYKADESRTAAASAEQGAQAAGSPSLTHHSDGSALREALEPSRAL